MIRLSLCRACVSGASTAFSSLAAELFLNETTEGITPICNHHEQACAMAAEVYARVTGKTGVLNVTTGPGGINALNGVFGAWTDSIPLLVLSGQVKRQTLMAAQGIRDLRQLGDQEADVIAMAKGITKYAQLITDPESIRYHLEKAWYLAASGRPGPVWLDIPVDVQSAMIDPEKLWAFTPPPAASDKNPLRALAKQTLDRIRSAKRPVILAGTGIRLGHAVDVFHRVIEKLQIPVTTAWTHDLLASDHPLHCGRPGTIGNRPGNFTVQNADTLLILGSRLNIRQVSYNWPAFARAAYKIWVDVDPSELKKPTVKPDLPVVCDVRDFLEELERQIDASTAKLPDYSEWISWCKQRVERYPALYGKDAANNGRLNPYVFVDELFRRLASDDVVVCGNATACIVPYQTAKLQAGQRLISNSGSASMGHDVPAAIGAAVARNGKRVICLAGDGSIQLNIQELQTIAHHRWPIKIFVLNNEGYLSIRTTQENFFKKMLGEGPRSGVSFPDILKIAAAYEIPSVRIDPENCDFETARALASDGPALCEVLLDPLQKFEPRLAARKLPDGRLTSPPLEDMFPFLDRDEFSENLLIPAWSGE
jgi:acetolactate synthase I/II/III large subunit